MSDPTNKPPTPPTSEDLGLVPRNIVAPLRVIRDYSPELAEEITDYFISGHSLAAISRMPGMPSTAHIYRWCKQFPEFRQKLTESREIRALAMEDMIVDSINPNLDSKEVPGARLAFDQAAWLAEKNGPKIFGKRVELGGGDQPLRIVVSTGIPEPTPQEQITQIVEKAVEDLSQAIAIEELKESSLPDEAVPEDYGSGD